MCCCGPTPGARAWAMEVYEDQLYVGTMDWSYLIFRDMIGTLPEEMPFSCNQFPDIDCDLLTLAYEEFATLFDPIYFYGSNLFRFSDSCTFAVPESLAGLGNYTNYGIRNMVASCGGLYAGTANPMNLLTDPTDDIPEGGWELIRLEPPNNDRDGDGVANACDICPDVHNPDQIFHPVDINPDCLIDKSDLDYLLGSLNTPIEDCPLCDINGDGAVTCMDVIGLVGIEPTFARNRRVRSIARGCRTRIPRSR